MYLYILFSEKQDRYYFGSTQDTVAARIIKHNCQHKGFTSYATDWQMVCQEFYTECLQALVRKKLIWGWKNRKLVEKLINHQ
ncbi:MAG: GIY-YIG nuclease family protein [Lentimicrobium sp.]|nr:GIY-YIG nuclease family protein [Lentimicrobium sp.]